MIDIQELQRLAYAMELAYKSEKNMGDAVHKVADQFPQVDTSTGILRAMWLAIDAYVDMNT